MAKNPTVEMDDTTTDPSGNSMKGNMGSPRQAWQTDEEGGQEAAQTENGEGEIDLHVTEASAKEEAENNVETHRNNENRTGQGEKRRTQERARTSIRRSRVKGRSLRQQLNPSEGEKTINPPGKV